MALAFVVNRLKAVFVFLFGVIKRALCCFRRRRKPSFNAIPLTAVGVVPSNAIGDSSGAELHSWNSWGDDPAAVVSQKDPVQQQIEQYRMLVARSNSVTSKTDEEPQPNFFEDMTPQITKQKKILLRSDDMNPAGWGDAASSRLPLAADPVPYSSPDLGAWEESTGWEDGAQEDWDPDAILREKRRADRHQRLAAQQQKRQERGTSKAGRAPVLGARIS